MPFKCGFNRWTDFTTETLVADKPEPASADVPDMSEAGGMGYGRYGWHGILIRQLFPDTHIHSRILSSMNTRVPSRRPDQIYVNGI